MRRRSPASELSGLEGAGNAVIIASDTETVRIMARAPCMPPNRPCTCSAQPRCSSSMPAQTEPMTIFHCTFR